MAEKTDVGTSGCIFLWKIENISHFWMKGEEILSPVFIVNTLEGTDWSVSLFPAGVNGLNEKEFNIYLLRLPGGDGPDVIEVNYQFAFLDKNGSILVEKTELEESFGYDSGFDAFVTRERVFVTEREAFLPEDTLTVQCTIWRTEEEPGYLEHISARTVFNLNRRSFKLGIEKFSTLNSGLKYPFKDKLFTFEYFLSEQLASETKFVINVDAFDIDIKYFAFKTSIVKSNGIKEDCDTFEYFGDDVKAGVLCTLLSTKKLMENKSQYLPNDVLSLEFEYVCSNGEVAYEYSGHGKITPQLKNEGVESRYEHIGKEESLNTLVLSYDLNSMYNDGIYSDVVLRTSTRTFPAHKCILGARSPVFRRMFSNDMQEMNCGYVDITDLEDDTLHRMLLYIYTGCAENLQFESASMLYVAADKYDIPSLQFSCSSFLIKNLCPENACDVLVLADQHHDNCLKRGVLVYLQIQQKQIFCSQEWKNFMNTHMKLASDVMYQNILMGCNEGAIDIDSD